MKKQDKNKNREYELSEYDPAWVDKFNELRSFLQKVFGNKALAIEHIGSTSIPGTTAKPVIDVLVVVDRDHMQSLKPEIHHMVQNGYEWGENYVAPNTHIFFKELVNGRKLNNIHVCEEDSPKTKQFLITRDFMRAHPQWVTKYVELKRYLHSKYPNDYVLYRKGKQDFLGEMERVAYLWHEGIENKRV